MRNVFVIGPDKKIKLILVYPMTTGRNFDEVRHDGTRSATAAASRRRRYHDQGASAYEVPWSL